MELLKKKDVSDHDRKKRYLSAHRTRGEGLAQKSFHRQKKGNIFSALLGGGKRGPYADTEKGGNWKGVRSIADMRREISPPPGSGRRAGMGGKETGIDFLFSRRTCLRKGRVHEHWTEVACPGGEGEVALKERGDSS